MARVSADTVKALLSPRDYYAAELPEAPAHRWRDRAWQDAGLCPFHDDKHAGSFRVHLGTGAYKCFACNAHGGDVLAFHMARYGLDFRGALDALARDCF